MKVALIHDYLNQYGGAERVLETLMEMFPEAPIYTILHDPEQTFGKFMNREIKTSLLDFPEARKNHRLFVPLMPLAMKTLKLEENYDVIISDTAGFAKGIAAQPRIKGQRLNVKHISYIHTPLRYAWEQENYLKGLISNFQFLISKPILHYLKNWDYRAAQKPDFLIANSQFIAEKIKKYYNREAKVIYPPVDTKKFYLEDREKRIKKIGYYLAVGRLLHYKRFDLVIDAFTKLGLPLKIVGSGPEEIGIKNQVSGIKNIEVLPFVNNENELRKLYNRAKALIFPQVEDFGLVVAEAQACGLPVVAYAAGGALEIVRDGKTGLFFNEQTSKALAATVEKSEKMRWNRYNISRSAQRFSKNKFKTSILKLLD